MNDTKGIFSTSTNAALGVVIIYAAAVTFAAKGTVADSADSMIV